MSQCPSTCFDCASREDTRCMLPAEPLHFHHSDGCMGWEEDLDPHPLNRFASGLEAAGHMAEHLLDRLGKTIHTHTDRWATALRGLR